MDWQKTAIDVLKIAAPTIGAVVGGPLGGAAGMILAKAITGDENTPLEEVQNIVAAASPDTLLKLKQAEMDFHKAMKEAEIDLERLAYDDTKDARNREIQTNDHWTPRILAAVVVGGFLGVVWFVISGQAAGLNDPVAIGLLGTLVGYVSAKADLVLGYFFGSSRGSSMKDQTINTLLSKRKDS